MRIDLTDEEATFTLAALRFAQFMGAPNPEKAGDVMTKIIAAKTQEEMAETIIDKICTGETNG